MTYLELLLPWSMVVSCWFDICNLWIRWGQRTMLVVLVQSSWLDVSYFTSSVLLSSRMLQALVICRTWEICQDIARVWQHFLICIMAWMWLTEEVPEYAAIYLCWMWVRSLVFVWLFYRLWMFWLLLLADLGLWAQSASSPYCWLFIWEGFFASPVLDQEDLWLNWEPCSGARFSE